MLKAELTDLCNQDRNNTSFFTYIIWFFIIIMVIFIYWKIEDITSVYKKVFQYLLILIFFSFFIPSYSGSISTIVFLCLNYKYFMNSQFNIIMFSVNISMSIAYIILRLYMPDLFTYVSEQLIFISFALLNIYLIFNNFIDDIYSDKRLCNNRNKYNNAYKENQRYKENNNYKENLIGGKNKILSWEDVFNYRG